MTPKQRAVYEFMKKFHKKYGFTPGMKTIALSTGDTKGAIQHVFAALEKKGLIIKKKEKQEGMYEVTTKNI